MPWCYTSYMLTEILSTIYVAATLTSGYPEYTPAIVKAIYPYVWQDPNGPLQPVEPVQVNSNQ